MASCGKTKALMNAIKKAGGGKVQTSSDTARKLAKEMGGMREGGYPVKVDLDKAAKATAARDAAARAKAEEARYRRMMGSQEDILRRGERIQKLEQGEESLLLRKPVKRAQGGAGKVRKGMMSQSGQILKVVKKK